MLLIAVMSVDFLPNLIFMNLLTFFFLFVGYPLTYGYEMTTEHIVNGIVTIITTNIAQIVFSMFIPFVSRLYRQVETQMKEYYRLLNRL